MGIVGIIIVLALAYVAFSAAWGLAGLIVALLVWALIGYVAGRLTRGAGFGAIGNVLVGLAGGVMGSFVFGLLGIDGLARLPFVGGFITGVIGAVLVITLANLISSNSEKRKISA